MALNFRKFSSMDDAAVFLKGHIIGGVDLTKNGSSLYLHGLTLVFNTPADSVTFTASPAAAQVPLTVQDVITQIEAQAAGVSARLNKGRLELYMTTPGAINLDKDGTANAKLGFSRATDTSNAPYNAPGGSAPALVSIIHDSGSNSYMVVTDDT